MTDEGVRTLYAPRESTTVWRKDDDPNTTVVATRKQLDPSGTALVVPTRDYASTSGVLDPPRYAQSGMVQVQIVKHNGTYLPLVDGLVPPREVVDGETIYLINHHRGMFEDEETRTWVFSPCAVSVCIEDGQALPERCVVSVWQHMVARGATRLTGKNQVKLGERELRPLRVSDPTASVVYAPYPALYSRPPRIIVNDMTAVALARQKGFKEAAFAFLSEHGSLMMRLLGKSVISGPSTLANLFSAAVDTYQLGFFGSLFSTAPDNPTDPNTPGLSRLKQLELLKDEVLRLVGYGPATPDAVPKVGTETTAEVASLSAGILGFWALVSGVPGAFAASKVLGEGFADQMRLAEVGEKTTWAGVAASSLLGVASGAINPQTWTNAGIEGISNALGKRVQPLPAKRYFTIGELATAIESLSAIMTLQTPTLSDTMANEKFASEAVVLQWLLAAEPGESFAVTSGTYSLAQIPNRVDLSEFIIAETAGIQTELRLDVEDNEGVDACNRRPLSTFRFSSNRADQRLLGHAMAGTIQDLKRLQRAIHDFGRMLKDQTNPLNPDGTPKPAPDYTKKNAAWTWFDYWIFDPVFSSVMARFRQKDPNQGANEKTLQKLLGEKRAIVLKYVLKNVQTKLHARFTTPHSEGSVLMNQLETALRDTFVRTDPTIESTIRLSPTYLRELPHKLQNPAYLFPSSTDADTNFVDVQLETGTLREYSSLHDAAKVGTRAARAASSAIVRAHRLWETEGPRCLFVHAFVDGASTPTDYWRRTTATYALLQGQDFYSLALQLPSDIRAAEASARLDEESERRILTLCHKGPAAEAAGTLLAHSKLPDTEAAFVAMSLFAELWTDELLKLHQLSEPTSRVVSAVQTAQVRAARRCMACGTFLEAVTVQSWSGLVPLSEAATADPALLATQAGRDAARLARRLQLVAQPVTARGVLSKAIVRRLRAIGATLVATGNRLATKPDADVLPSEPLQALFMKPVHGLHAYARATALSNLDPLVATAIAAAYPSSLLMTDQMVDQASRDLVRADATPQRPPVQPDVARIVQRRMAALRFDYPDTVHLDETTKALHASDAALVDAMSSLSLASEPRTLAFYVPYGYGQAPPRLVYPPVPAPMFGSVPVWTEDVLASIDALLASLDAPTVPSNSADTLMARICPVFPCGDTSRRPLPAHPSLLEAHLRNVATNAIDVCFWASEPELGNVLDAGTAPTPNRANEAAKRHVLGMQERKLASRVCTLAWNAERILQSLLLLVGEFDDTQLATSLILGDGDARVAVPRRGESDEDIRIRLERELEDARYTAERDANWHFAELRRTMNLIETHIATATAPPPAPSPPAPSPATPSTTTPDAPGASNAAPPSNGSAVAINGIDLSSQTVQGGEEPDRLGHANADSTTGVGLSSVLSMVSPAWYFLQLVYPEVFTTEMLLGATATVAGAAAAWKSARAYRGWRKRVNVRKDAESKVAQLRLKEYRETAASSWKTASKECVLPFLRYDDAQWQSWADPSLDIDAKREILKAYVDDSGRPLPRKDDEQDQVDADVYNTVVGTPRFADGLRSELERLRSSELVFIDDLINASNCPPGGMVMPWEIWVLERNKIVERALAVFLDDEITKWELDPDQKAQEETAAVSNPATQTRRAAYETVKSNVSNLIGPNAANYAEGVNLIFYGNRAEVSYDAYRQKKTELENHQRASAERATMQDQVQRRVRMHVLAAGVVGNALARGVLRGSAPQVLTLDGPNARPLSSAKVADARQLFLSLRRVLGSNAKEPSSLRLSELCAIVQSVLID